MKFFETTFDEYETAVSNFNLHSKIETNVFSKFPENFEDLRNVILYGPPGIGKYSQAIHCIKKYSPSQLKYVKKLNKVALRFEQGIFFCEVSYY